MSQHWHGHWMEETFTAKRLRNWEVSKWYPSWPDRHCGTTKFITNDNGHILDSTKKAKCSSWGTYKSTWDLPKRITRSIAEELAATPQYKKEIWELHKKKHENLCKKMKQAKKEMKTKKDIELPTNTEKTDRTDEIQKSREQAEDPSEIQESREQAQDSSEIQESRKQAQDSSEIQESRQDPDLCKSAKKNGED